MCATRSGQILNLSALALDCGLTHNTAKTWLSVLETSGLIYLLLPHHRNFGKRLVKSPTLYFIGAGLAARLLGIRNGEQLFLHPARGKLFESFVISELPKSCYNEGRDPDFYFWRDSSGTEVDLLVPNQATVLPTGLSRVIPASYHLANSISRKTNSPACFSLDLALLVICWAFLKVRVKVRVGVLDENVREKFRVWGAGSALNSSMS